jgi:hypothetical protein
MDEALAVYGALQRLLKKINKEYPYITEKMRPDLMNDFSVPSKFYLKIGLSPEIFIDKSDYTECSPELGDKLLKKLMEEK